MIERHTYRSLIEGEQDPEVRRKIEEAYTRGDERLTASAREAVARLESIRAERK